VPTDSENFQLITGLLKRGAFETPEGRREAAEILKDLESQTQYLTKDQKNELSASVDDTLGAGGYPSTASFWELWPKRPYFEAYQQVIEKSESPPVYHFFAAATVLGAAAGIRISYPTQPSPLYPNMSVCLVGPTGKIRKGTSLKPAIEMLEALNVEESRVSIIYNKANPRSLVQFLSQKENAECLLYAPELSAFISKDRSSENFAPTLADLLDTHMKAGDLTIRWAQQVLNNTCISLLAASNIDWLLRSTPRDMLTGGLMNRIVFVVQEERHQRLPLRDWLNPPGRDVMAGTFEYLQWANRLERCSAVVTKDGENEYDNWYLSLSDNIDPVMAAYVERKQVHVMRLALILTLADKRCTVGKNDYRDAIAIMAWVERFIPLMLERMQGVTQDPSKDYVIRKIQQSIELDPESEDRCMTRSKLLRDSHWGESKLNRVLKAMVASGYIRRTTEIPERYVIQRVKK